jgi:hypothetical protein
LGRPSRRNSSETTEDIEFGRSGVPSGLAKIESRPELAAEFILALSMGL